MKGATWNTLASLRCFAALREPCLVDQIIRNAAKHLKVLYDDLIHFDESVADLINSTGSN